MILNYITWNVDPVLFSIGSLSVRWYGLLWALGFLIGYFIMRRIYRREKMTDDSLDKLLIYMLLFTVVGARLGHCLFYEPEYYLSHPLKMLAVWEGGLASHGGAIGILLGLWFYVRSYICGTVDNYTPCSTGNCCPPSEWLPCHPTGLYEAFFCLVAMGILLWMYYKRDLGHKQPGLMFGTFLVIIFGSRIGIEFLKNVQVEFERNMVFDMGQWLSVPFVLIGIGMIVWSFGVGRPIPY